MSTINIDIGMVLDFDDSVDVSIANGIITVRSKAALPAAIPPYTNPLPWWPNAPDVSCEPKPYQIHWSLEPSPNILHGTYPYRGNFIHNTNDADATGTK